MAIVFGSAEALEQRYRDALNEALMCRECGAAPYSKHWCDDCKGYGHIFDDKADEDEDAEECDVCFGKGHYYECPNCGAEIMWYEYESAQEDVKRKFGKLPDGRKMAARYRANG